ncbi:MAG: GSU2403 family nucleotidyltransferase fold protein [bacterium]|nr:GSU2403 family nucleotidyltransferase fold protein [bacterium]
MRTLDLDFLIPGRQLAKAKADIPSILGRLGFEPVRQYPSGLVKFGHPDLEVEFLVTERGKGTDRPIRIDTLGINAQPLRFLTVLGDHTMETKHGGVTVRLPEPAAYVMHKFIIARRRARREKEERDLLAAKELGEFILGNALQRSRMREIFSSFPRKWRRKVLDSVKSESDSLRNFLKGGAKIHQPRQHARGRRRSSLHQA